MSEALTAVELQERLSHSPFIRFLGLTVTEADPARQCVTMTLPMRPEFERIAGSGQWHGGPIAAVIDTVGDYALVMSIGRPLPTINFRVDYLRPAVNTALRLPRGCGAPGRSVGVVDVDVMDAGGGGRDRAGDVFDRRLMLLMTPLPLRAGGWERRRPHSPLPQGES
jgi:uncharacterized protein (TIGR00369 family)